jgi:hypothetical protein
VFGLSYRADGSKFCINPAAESTVFQLLQLRVLCLGLVQDGDVGVGILPECEETLVSGERTDVGGIGIRALRGFSL